MFVIRHVGEDVDQSLRTAVEKHCDAELAAVRLLDANETRGKTVAKTEEKAAI